jgi:hypothetical protein
MGADSSLALPAPRATEISGRSRWGLQVDGWADADSLAGRRSAGQASGHLLDRNQRGLAIAEGSLLAPDDTTRSERPHLAIRYFSVRRKRSPSTAPRAPDATHPQLRPRARRRRSPCCSSVATPVRRLATLTPLALLTSCWSIGCRDRELLPSHFAEAWS